MNRIRRTGEPVYFTDYHGPEIGEWKKKKKCNVLDPTFMPLSGEIETGGPSHSWLHGHRSKKLIQELRKDYV